MVDLVGQLGDDDAGPSPAVLLDLDDATHLDRPAAGLVRVLDTLGAHDQAGRGEVGSLDPLHHGLAGGFLVGLVILQAPVHGLRELAEVVRRDVGGHAHGDTARTVGQQVGEPARQNRGLLHPSVVVRDEIDCLLVDFTQHLHRQRSESRFGVTHGRWRIVTRRAEVALAVHQRVAQRPRLGHADQGVVDRGVAVRMVVTHRLGNGARGFGVAAIRTEARVVHRVQHAAVHGLETVAHLGQRAAHDHAHGVVDVAALHLLLDVDRFDPVVRLAFRRQRRISHESILDCRIAG